eukprot:686509-Prymnesium_polylepis.2
MRVARRRCDNAGAGRGADERPQRLRAVRGLLARRHEGRVGFFRRQRESMGWVAPARPGRPCARGG